MIFRPARLRRLNWRWVRAPGYRLLFQEGLPRWQRLCELARKGLIVAFADLPLVHENMVPV